MKKMFVVGILLAFLIQACSSNQVITMPNNPGGQSGISYLQKIRSGLVFMEGFENDNFVNAEGWTTVQGIPANSSNQYLPGSNGIKSFACNGTGSTLSIISKAVPTIPVGTLSNQPLISCYFYDDGTTTAGTGPYLKAETSGGYFFQVGVRNDVSTGFYVCNAAASGAEDNFGKTTTIARTVGWHKFEIWLPPTGSLTIRIDGTVVLFSNVVTTSENFTYAFICSGTTSDTGGTFGYFDQFQIFSNITLTVNGGTGKTLIVQDSTGTIVGSPTSLPGGFAIANILGATAIFPQSVRFIISQSGSAAVTEFVSAYYQIYPGDIYSYNCIALGRKIETPGYTSSSYQLVNTSPTGNVETIVTGQKDKLTTSISQLQGMGWTQLIRNWYQYAVTGAPYSIMTDNNFDNAFGVNSASVVAGGQTITIMPNLSANPTDAFNTNALTNTNGVLSYANNYIYTIRNYAGTKKQTVTVASKTGTTLTFNETLNFALAQGDYIYSEYFFPFLEIDGADLSGFTLYDKNIPSYNWVQKHKEYINT